MRHMLIVLGIIIAAIAVGTGLYIYGPSELRETPVAEGIESMPTLEEDGVGSVTFSIIGEGSMATDVAERKNFAIYDAEEFERVWTMAYGEDAPALPVVDFDTQYVIAAFAGEKPSGGYAIDVTSVMDAGNLRSVAMTLTKPGNGCVTTQALTSPFQFVTVPSSGRALSRTDVEITADCD